MRPGDKPTEINEQVNVPEGSVLIAQINGRGRPILLFEDKTGKTEATFDRNSVASRAELALSKSGLVQLRLGSEYMRWPIAVTSDVEPRVTFEDTPAATDEGLVGFTIATFDDYGIVHAQLQFRLDPEQERPLDAAPFDHAALAIVRTVEISGNSAGE